jgi:hypothetical protein
MLKRAAALVSSGVQLITLLALDDEGAPGFNQRLAGKMAALGVPSFACSPDVFPDFMAVQSNGETSFNGLRSKTSS